MCNIAKHLITATSKDTTSQCHLQKLLLMRFSGHSASVEINFGGKRKITVSHTRLG